jgi:hypothetical protein
LVNFAEGNVFSSGTQLAAAFEASLPRWSGLKNDVKLGQAVTVCADEKAGL